MSSGGTQSSLRKTLGSLKDSTTVNLAKINSDYKEVDIAVVRATNHVERPAKEKHIRATSRCCILNTCSCKKVVEDSKLGGGLKNFDCYSSCIKGSGSYVPGRTYQLWSEQRPHS